MSTYLHRLGAYIFLFFLLVLGGSANAFEENIFLSTVDIEAGQTETIRISGLTREESVRIELERPEKNNLSFDLTTNVTGSESFVIPSLHTETSGEYFVHLYRSFSQIPSVSESFIVSPGSISRFKSQISLSEETIPADGKSFSKIEVAIADAFGNPIPNVDIRGFSSRNEDRVILPQKTDANGKAFGKVFSATPGVGIISLLAGDIILFEKPEIVFHMDSAPLKNAGSSGFGKYLQSSLFNSDNVGTASTEYFTIEGLNPEQTANEDLTIRVSAKDANGNVDTGYTGTIRFSSTDNKAILPSDYTFKPTDQGVHTFYLAISFGTVGQQTLSVLDIDDFRVSGELSVNVLPQEGDNPPPQNGDGCFGINIPTNGAKFSASRITLSGCSDICPAIKIVDGPTVLVEGLAVDTNGQFSYQTPNLADGYHEFQIQCASNEDLVSEKVGINVDRSAPTVLSVELSPSSCVEPGNPFEIKVGSSEELSNASCTVNNQSIGFEALDIKTFSGNANAPNTPGQYPIQCSIFDVLGNELYEENAGLLEVCSAPDEPEPEEPPTENVPPSCVSNLNAKPGDGKVTLFWSPAEDDTGIQNYTVLYGECGGDLTNVNTVPDARTQWYVDGLEACKKYCFAVSPIDENGMENQACKNDFNNFIEEAPICSEPPKITPPKSGRNSAIPFIVSLLIGGLSFFFLVKQKSSL